MKKIKCLCVLIVSIVFFLFGCNLSSTAPSLTIPTTSSTQTITTPFTVGNISNIQATDVTTTKLPTIIITSTKALGDYKIKSRTEEDTISVITGIKSILSDTSNYNRFEIENSLITLEREFLLRFPESKYFDDIRQDVLLQEVKNFVVYPLNEPLANKFMDLAAETLNSGQIQPSALGEWLQLKNLNIVTRTKTENLFGNGQTAEVIQVETNSYPIKSIILVLIGSQPGNYELTSLRSRWFQYYALSTGGKEIISVNDLNGNGQPEILSIINTENPQVCSTKLALYEWRGDYPQGRFVNIASNVNDITGDYIHSNCDQVWNFSLTNSNNTQSIIQTVNIHNWAGDSCPAYKDQTLYKWIDNSYRWAGLQVEAIDTSSSAHCIVGWVNEAAHDNLYPEVVSLLASVLEDWPTQLNKIWGPDAENYFRFKLGTWYALLEQTELAKITLQNVQDSNSDFKLISRMAAAYLAVYQQQGDSFLACIATREIAEDEFANFSSKGDMPELVIEKMQQTWGFAEPDWFHGPELLDVCNTSDAFEQEISKAKLNTKDELIKWFDQKNIPVWIVEASNLTSDDNSKDWLAIIKTRANQADLWEVWGLIDTGDEFTAAQIPFGYSPLYNLSNKDIDLIGFSPNETLLHVNIFLLEGRLNVFYIIRQKDLVYVQRLFGKPEISSFKLKNQADQQYLVLDQEKGTSEVYIWSPQQQRFVAEQPALSKVDQQVQTIELIEETLFQIGDVPEALKLLQNLFDNSLLTDVPFEDNQLIQVYLRYLLGLSYELSGSKEEAINTYWQIWQDYPDSPYKLIIQQKLE